MNHLDVVTTFLNPGIDDNNIYMTLPHGWPEGLHTPKIIIRLRNTLYGLKQCCGYGTTISMLVNTLMGKHNPWAILTSIFVVMAF